ncbi:hypothetical protein [Ectothiorhodospira sp. BSL-9]|uniref:hypothetical protein n=1 Tax=Ectothiorhodospira sp. BSL-9 TaxID=1442136 RepID=UPI00196A1653|nr:hypothetical protein [Ectothiorhodospira sp. BSL-9]
MSSANGPVLRCLDPFGGSGTTGLACQFLGVHPVMVEVNPFLADLIEAKLQSYDPDSLATDLGRIVRASKKIVLDLDLDEIYCGAPATLIEPGLGERWVFDREIAERIAALRLAVNSLENEAHRRLFRVLLGGILVQASNVIINGKGRRYRRGWKDRPRSPGEVDQLFCNAARRAVSEVFRYGNRSCATYDILRGDCRRLVADAGTYDIAVFSPPYPNSFDYTDVYNLELWMLGYLMESPANRELRASTLCSHVQIARDYPTPPVGCGQLLRTMESLECTRPKLWNRWIPEMVGGYFSDMVGVLEGIYTSLTLGGSVWMVVGDSRYSDIKIETGEILAELSENIGYEVVKVDPFRSMRASAQQGGGAELSESLIVLAKR